MRRAAAVALTGAVTAGLALAAGGEPDTYRVHAIFDSTAHLIPGQDVKIAGAKVGTVTDIELTKDRRARVEMEIERGFAPFRADADCIIRPQSLIGEKFVQCSPGSPDAPPLARDGDAPTVPLEQTHSPIDLDLVFASLRRPYSERLAILVNELGTGLAGRGDDLNDAVRRANPALAEANDVLSILDDDRATLGRLIERSDRIIEELSARKEHVASFIERANTTAEAVAARRDDLGETIRRLPPLLDELEPTARRLEQISSDATPIVRDLRRAAPGIDAVLADLDPLNDAARPALVRLAEMSKIGRRAVKVARPVARDLETVADQLPYLTELGADLNESLRKTGAVEGLQRFVYYGAAAQARFDSTSHMLPSYQIAGACQQYARTPVPECDAHFGGAGTSESAGRVVRRSSFGARARGRQRGGRRPDRGPGDERTTDDAAPRLPGLPRLPDLVVTDQLLDFLLGNGP